MSTTQLLLHRTVSTTQATVGTLKVVRRASIIYSCKTLELPWRDNVRRLSCIPAGTYTVIKRTYGRYYAAYKKRWGHEFGLEVADVDGRGDILIHTGNTTSHTLGCILVGTDIHGDPDDPQLLASRVAYNSMHAHLNAKYEDEWDLQVVDGAVVGEDESEDVGDRSDL